MEGNERKKEKEQNRIKRKNILAVYDSEAEEQEDSQLNSLGRETSTYHNIVW